MSRELDEAVAMVDRIRAQIAARRAAATTLAEVWEGRDPAVEAFWAGNLLALDLMGGILDRHRPLDVLANWPDDTLRHLAATVLSPRPLCSHGRDGGLWVVPDHWPCVEVQAVIAALKLEGGS